MPKKHNGQIGFNIYFFVDTSGKRNRIFASQDEANLIKERATCKQAALSNYNPIINN